MPLRPTHAPSSILDRATPNLPSRPEVPIPGGRESREFSGDRHQPRHADRRDLRDRLHDPRTMDRPGGRPVDRRDFPSNDRRALEPNTRDFARPDRSSGIDRERSRLDPPPRWTPDSARENHSRDANSSRGTDNLRMPREMPPPRTSLSAEQISTDRLPSVNPARQDLINPINPINPERQALISGEKDVPRSNSPRRGREDTRDRGSSRPQSPRRSMPDKDYQEPRRDDRLNRSSAADIYNSSRGRMDEGPPAGPRSERPSERGNDRVPFTPSQPPLRPPPIDQEIRRNVPPRQQDPNFGRLNNPQNTVTPSDNIPSGPRDRNIRGNYMNNVATPPQQQRERPRPPTPDKQPPTGPSSRHPRHSNSTTINTGIPPGPSSSTAAPSPASAGIHPERIQLLTAQSPPNQPPAVFSQSRNQTATPGNQQDRHDRSRRFDNNYSPSMPPPMNNMNNMNSMNNNRLRPHMPPLVTNEPPSGPKGVQSSPANSGSNGFGVPTGPASASERANRGTRRSERPASSQVGAINHLLQNAAQKITPDRSNFRRGGRMSSGYGPETPTSGPSTPIVPPPPPGPPPFTGRNEPVRDIAKELITPIRGPDLISQNSTPTEDREQRSSRHSGRHSRRSSRSPGRDRESKRAGAENERNSRS